MSDELKNQTPINMFMSEDEDFGEFAPSGSFTTTAQAMWQIGFMVFDTHSNFREDVEGRESLAKFFPYPAKSNTATRTEVFEQAKEYIAKNDIRGAKGKPRIPMKGIQLTISGDDVPSHPDGRFEWGNSTEFISELFAKPNMAVVNEYIGKLGQPLPIDNLVWCKLERVEDEVRTAAGEMRTISKKDDNGNVMYDDDGKEITQEVPYTITVPIASYTTRDEAIADMDVNEPDAAFELSDKAKAGYQTVANLRNYASEMEAGITAYVSGEKMALEPKALDPMGEDEAIAKVADKYDVEVSDIKNLLNL